ncbi:hypothetical protein ACS0TY_000365 [Phlomoides rotata]
MQALQRWRSTLILKNTIAQSKPIAATTTTFDFASFHSTAALSEKRKNKFNFDVRGDQKPPKASVTFKVREKREQRADAKKALKRILFSGGCSTSRDQSFSKIEADYTDRLNKRSRIKRPHQSKKVYHKKLKRNHRRENLCEDSDYDPERIFYATFGKHGFRTSGKGFDWAENSGWTNHRFDEQDAKSRTESHPFYLGTYADRKTLGLPTTGRLSIEDVKTAFRSSALKWHPDRHQGPSRATATEKFKDCVTAYNSLCTTLSTT